MPRHLLDEARLHPSIRLKVSVSNRDIVDEVIAAIEKNPVVVVGMAINPHPRRVKKALEEHGTPFKYLGYGSYFSQWRRRTALKMWTGWPTFPMVFVHGVLVGGASDVKKLIATGEWDRLVEAA